MKFSISVIGCGWLGLPLSKFFAENGHAVRGSTTSKEKIPQILQAGVTPFLLDLNENFAESPDIFRSNIIIVTIPPSSKNYLKSIKNLIHFLTINSVERVIFISSTSVYPNLNREVFENDARSIISPRSGIALLDVERLFTDNTSFETTVIRFAGLYGPGREPGKFMRDKKIISGGRNPVNLIHLDDCISIISQLINNRRNGIFNACADKHPTKMDFYSKASKTLGLPPPDFSDTMGDHKQINSEKLKRTLNYRFIHPDPMGDV